MNKPGLSLCIGDKGEYPGNDYELLSTQFSLSVNEVSYDPDTCWNLSKIGFQDVNATINYLIKCKIINKQFRFKL